MEALLKKFRKYTTVQLLSKVEKTSGKEWGAIVSILESRGQDVSKWRKEVVNQLIQDSIDLESDEEQTSPSINLLGEILDAPKVEPSKRDLLIKEVDEFVDSLIVEHRNGVYVEVMKALGGKFDSDLDELLEKAPEAQLKEALSFKGIKSNKPEVVKAVQKARIDNQKAQEKFERDFNKQSIDISEKEKTFKVEFITAKNSKKAPSTRLEGLVIKFFICPKVNKQFFKIKTDLGIFLKRADSCKRI